MHGWRAPGLAFLVGCQGSGELLPQHAQRAVVELGVDGGVVETEGVRLTVPPGALSADVVITVAPAGAAPEALFPRSTLYQFGPPGLEFQVPAEVAFDFDGPEDGALVYWSRGPSDFEALPTMVVGPRAVASVEHFSMGFVASTPPDTGDVGGDSGLPTTSAAAGYGHTWCWTVAPIDEQLALIEVDMDAGTWSEVGRYGADVYHGFYTGGLARVGDTLVMSAYTGNDYQLVEVDLSQGTVMEGRDLDLGVSIGTDGTDLFLHELRDICRYPGLTALEQGLSTQCFDANVSSRLGVTGNEIYGAWHSTGAVVVLDKSSGAHLRTIWLSQWHTWVWGVSVAGGMLHLIDDGRGRHQGAGVRIARFDPITGDQLDHLDVDATTAPARASGLWCEEY